jgi:DmsE family decaheme c-type cytochrome
VEGVQPRHLTFAALAACLLFLVSLPRPAAAQPAPAGPAPATAGATFVGEKTCLQCHQTPGAQFAHTQHAQAFREHPKSAVEARVCEACHGPGSAHVQNPTNRLALISFTKGWGTPVATQNAVCLSCHNGGERLHWQASSHSLNKVACSDCHNPMARLSETGLLSRASANQVCEGCHTQQRNEFRRRSHMPLPEGKMTCNDCHNPHGSATKPMLRGASINEVCFTCHADKRGPFLWEHAPVRENCASCHLPHGSNQEKLLTSPRPFLCQQCHDAVNHSSNLFNQSQLVGGGGALNPRLLARACQNCHVQIHGSNHPSGARFQR